MESLTALIISPAIPAALGLGGFLFLVAWASYSVQTQKSLRKGPFAIMELLSETRPGGYGDSSRVPGIARRFSRGSIVDLRRSFVHHIAGDVFAPESVRGSIRVKGDVAFEYTSTEMAVYGRRRPTSLSLRELVSQKTVRMEIEEDVFERLNWSQEMGDCVPIQEQNETTSIGGSFSFCHRDYVNHEELVGMMWKRHGIEGFLFQPSRADVLTVDKTTQRCLLTARSKLFRIVPICIRWEGTLKEGTVRWHSTSLAMGWERFGKFFDKPAAAEKLRKDPWRVSVPKDDSTGDILCFDREGKGHLVFAKEECLSGGPQEGSPK